jgi:hypothetical protein
MAINASKFPPKTTTELLNGTPEARPVPYEAVAGDPAVNIFTGDREWSEAEGHAVPNQKPLPITVHIDGDNLVDIIADLTGRIAALEA